MINRKIGIFALLLCFCFCFVQLGMQVASASDTSENTCSLTVSYRYGETAFSDVPVKLYKVADFTADYRYILTPSFTIYGLSLNGLQNTGEWNVVRSTLEAHIVANGIAPDMVSATDPNGSVYFDAIEKGMYLAVADLVVRDQWQYLFDAALVAVPGRNQDGSWYNAVSVNAKAEALPPVDSDEEIQLKLLKLWKGDQGQTNRPETVTVEIFRNGVSCETVVLSEENHWCYTWSAKDDGATWFVVERNVPQGYSMNVEQKESAFVLTNTWIPTTPEDPDDPTNPTDTTGSTNPADPTTSITPTTPKAPDEPPKTGDTTNTLLYILLMTISGTMLIVLGVTGKKASL